MWVVIAEGSIVEPRFVVCVLPLKAQRLVDLVDAIEINLAPRSVVGLPDNLACGIRNFFGRSRHVRMKIIDLWAIQVIPYGVDTGEGSVAVLFVAVEARRRLLLGLMLSLAEQAQPLPQEVRIFCVGGGRLWVMACDRFTNTAAQWVVVISAVTDLLMLTIHLCANQAIIAVILKVLLFIRRGALDRIAPRIIAVAVAVDLALAVVVSTTLSINMVSLFYSRYHFSKA